MRSYIRKQNIGGVPDSVVSTRLGGQEINSYLDELSEAVERSGQTLAPANGANEDVTQLAQSLFLHGAGATTFVDGGSANAVVLTPATGLNGFLLPSDLTIFNGVHVEFIPSAVNTGASTLDIGQESGSLLGAKKILNVNGTELEGAELATDRYIECVYNSSADSGAGAWILVSMPSGGVVSLLSTRSTMGTWTLNNLEIGRPLIIGISATGTERAQLSFGINSGANIGFLQTQSSRVFKMHVTDLDAERTPPSFTTIPTSSTVEIRILGMGSGITAYAYQ